MGLNGFVSDIDVSRACFWLQEKCNDVPYELMIFLLTFLFLLLSLIAIFNSQIEEFSRVVLKTKYRVFRVHCLF